MVNLQALGIWDYDKVKALLRLLLAACQGAACKACLNRPNKDGLGYCRKGS